MKVIARTLEDLSIGAMPVGRYISHRYTIPTVDSQKW